MDHIEYQHILPSSKKPWVALIALFLILAGSALFIGQVLIMLLIAVIPELTLSTMSLAMTNPEAYPEMRMSILLVQGVSALSAFIIAPVIYHYSLVGGSPLAFIPKRATSILPVLMVVFITISFMAVNSIFIELNANVEFPAFLEGFEAWAQQMEKRMELLTKYLTKIDSAGYFIVAFIVVAIIPAIGEEWLFRGYLQPLLTKMTGNIHVGVWLAAIIFSAFHVQFFGFLPRLLLGALFGYLFVWSGSLLYAIIGHFINNGLSIIFLYLDQQGMLGFDAESTEALPWVAIIPMGIVFVFLLYTFYDYFKRNNFDSGEDITNEKLAESI